MKITDFIPLILLFVLSSLQLSNAFHRSRNKQTAVRSDDELLHYVAECPVNYVIELNPITTGRNNALAECERTLWKIVFEHCQGQQTCKVSLPWVDMLKNKVECLNEIEDYRPFHYQCRSFTEGGPPPENKGIGFVSALYEMARKSLSSGEIEGKQGHVDTGPKTAKASSSRRVSMTRTHRTANSHSRSSVRMSSSRKVSASWNTWNSPNSDNDVHGEIQAIMAATHPWNGWNGQRSGHGWTSFGANQGHGANWNSWGMWNHLSPTPDRGNVEHRSQWMQWNNAQNDGVHRNPQNVIPGVDHNIQGNNIIPNGQGIGGQQWTSWNGPRGWASWAARFSKGSSILFLGIGNYVVICITGVLIFLGQRQ